MDKAPSAQLQAIAQLRLARVLFAAENTEAALALLSESTDDANVASAVFAPQKAELAGDIYMSLGEHQQAYDSYLQAQLSAAATGASTQPLLGAKIGYAKSFL